MQQQLRPASSLPPHPATVARSQAAQPSFGRSGGLAPHPATIAGSKAIQPQLSGSNRPLAPHPATVARSSGLRGVAQRSSGELDVATLDKVLTRYHPRDMAGQCVVSAEEVGAVLAKAGRGAAVGYRAVVYRDKTGAVRNHVAATLGKGEHEQVVDATWKQFAYLQARDVKEGSWLRIFGREEWLALIAEHTPGMTDAEHHHFDDIEDAKQWMSQQRKDLPQSARLPTAAGKGGTRGCTLF